MFESWEKAQEHITAEVQRRIDADGSVVVPKVALEIYESFGAQPSFLSDYWVTSGLSAVYDVVRRCAVYGSPAAGSRGPDKRSAESSDDEHNQTRFGRWVEHAGDRHLLLLRMTRTDLRLAMTERAKRVGGEVTALRLLKQLDDKLQSDDEMVGDRFTEVEIGRLYNKLAAEVEEETEQWVFSRKRQRGSIRPTGRASKSKTA